MIKKLIICFVLFSSVLNVQAYSNKELKQYLFDTPSVVEQGKYEEALGRYVWFYNNILELEPSLSAVRNSYGLSFWLELGKKYPPALEELLTIRNYKLNMVLSGRGTKQLFKDVVAINKTLHQNEVSMHMFESIRHKQPNLAKDCWDDVARLFIEDKNFKIAKEFYSDLYKVFNQWNVNFPEFLSSLDIKSSEEEESLINFFISKCNLLIEVADATGEIDVAKEIEKEMNKTVQLIRINKIQ